MFSRAASIAATTMLIQSFTSNLVPSELSQYILTKFRYCLARFTNEITIVIDECEGLNKNSLFYAAETYMSTIFDPYTRIFQASLPEKEKKIHISIAKNQELRDKFCGIEFKWRMVSQESKERNVYYDDEYGSHSAKQSAEVRHFELSFHKQYKNRVVDDYLPYILERSKSIKQEMKTLKLLTLNNSAIDPWQAVNLDHPSTFETLAMDEEIKKTVIDDLDRFLKRRDYYKRVGKAWKRGYLLYGPPGTGKSSLIAAMANYLNFDVYDLELTGIRTNSELRRKLIATANRSILVVEDIDASIDLTGKRSATSRQQPLEVSYLESKVTLSGFLNVIDGLWSSCGDERIIVFTTNHKDKLDPALLRPGRMDVHIHMSYCTPCGFKMLVSSYLGITEHPLIEEVEQIIGTKKVTPAEVGEQLLKSDDPQVALRGLIEFIEKKESENHQVAKTKVGNKKRKKGLVQKKVKKTKVNDDTKEEKEEIGASVQESIEELGDV